MSTLPLQAWIQEFFQAARGPQQHRKYAWFLRRLEAYAQSETAQSFPLSLDRTDLLSGFLQIPACTGWASSTRRDFGFTLRGFAAWLLRQGHIEHNVCHYVSVAQIVEGKVPGIWLRHNLQGTILRFEEQLRRQNVQACARWVKAAHRFNLYRNENPAAGPEQWIQELVRSTPEVRKALYQWVGLEHFLEFWVQHEGQGQDWVEHLRGYRSRSAVLRALKGGAGHVSLELRRSSALFESGLASWLEAFLEHRRQRRMRIDTLIYELKRLDRIARQHQLQEPEQFTSPQLLDFLSHNDPAPRTWNQRLAKLRGLQRFLARRGRRLQLPSGWLGRTPAAFRPHLFTLVEIGALLATLRGFGESGRQARGRRRCQLRWHGLETIVFLLYACGLRLREPLRLRLGDVDLVHRRLFLNETKFYKQRWVPVGEQAARRLADYREQRRLRWGDDDPTRAFFLTSCGRPFPAIGVRNAFTQALKQVGIISRGTRHRPRLHDLRHTAAVHKLYQWYSEGADVQNKLPLLSAYLGHDRMHHTEVYLHLTDDLLRQAGGNFRTSFEEVVGPRLDDDGPTS